MAFDLIGFLVSVAGEALPTVVGKAYALKARDELQAEIDKVTLDMDDDLASWLLESDQAHMIFDLAKEYSTSSKYTEDFELLLGSYQNQQQRDELSITLTALITICREYRREHELSIVQKLQVALIIEQAANQTDRILDAISKLLSITQPPAKPTIQAKNIPYQKEGVIARSKLLSQIETGFSKSNTNRVEIIGEGGFGKTVLAIMYYYKHPDDYSIAWIVNAESEDTINKDYLDLAEQTGLKIEPDKIDFEAVKRYVLRLLENHDNYLVVYDNAERMGNKLKDYLPVGKIQGHILICTRNALGISDKPIDVREFTMPEAVSFLRKRIPGFTKPDAERLATKLLNLPLALELAASYISTLELACDEYLSRYSEHGFDLLKRPGKAYGYHDPIETTWQLSMELIRSEDESLWQLINLCAYCAPDDIPLDLFAGAHESLPDALKQALDPAAAPDYTSLIFSMNKFSILTHHRVNKRQLLSMHRIIQDSIRDHLDINGDLAWLYCCLEAASSAIPTEFGTRKSREDFLMLLPHVAALDACAAQHINEEKRLAALSLVDFRSGNGLDAIGEYQRALEWYEKALAIYEEVLGDRHPDTATTYNNMAGVYRAQGDYARALEFYGKALAIKEEVLGEKHPSTAATYNNMAAVYHDQGDYARALEWHGKALAIREEVLGDWHPDTAATYNNMAAAYRDQGDYARALEFFWEALIVFISVFGIDHPNTQTVYTNMMSAYEESEHIIPFDEWLKNHMESSSATS